LRKVINRIVITGTAMLLSLSFTANTFGYTKLYESRESSIVVKGVTYDKGEIYTTEGMVDYHILKIDLKNENIKIKPVESKTEIALKETVESLVNSHGAVAGVNSAYFGLAGDHSASFGPVIADGELISVGTDKNRDKNEFAAFFIDEYGESFMDYARVDLEFLNDGESNLSFASINKITEMIYPIYFDKNGGENTEDIDKRFPGLVKIVVDGGKIVYISEKGETVDVPEDGYVIIISAQTADSVLDKFAVGQEAEFNIISSVDFEGINSAISGGGIILEDGVKPADIGQNVTDRNPRTLLGTDKEGKTLVLMCIDGKRAASSSSIGATLDEAIELLKAEGVYNAMSLDGGGSTTMVADFGADGKAELLNKPATGAQRKVTTAAAVFDESETGDIRSLVIEKSKERGFYGSEVVLSVYGLDKNHHRIEVPLEDVKFGAVGGDIKGNVLTIKTGDIIPITASYKGAEGSTSVQGLKVSYLSPSKSTVTLEKGGTSEISFTLTSADGYSEPITGVKLKSDFVDIDGNRIIGVKEGAGFVECELNGLKTYVKVGVGTSEGAVTSFEGYTNLGYSAYPKDIEGIASASTAVVYEGANSVAISYNFKESTATQAAYLTFNDPIKIEGEPTKLKLAIYGDGSGNWIRGKIRDAKDEEYVIDFTRDMSWKGWQDAEALIPAEVAYPITFEMVYVAALSNSNLDTQAVYFDDLRADVGAEITVETPSDVRINDNLMKDIHSKTGGYYITLGGNVVSKEAYEKAEGTTLYTDARLAAFNALNKTTDLIYYAGGTDISKKANAETVVYGDGYKAYDRPNVTIIEMSAAKGSIKNTDAKQWMKFREDITKAGNKNVIFVMDVTPSYFEDKTDMEMFRKALNDIKNEGRNVFVVSASGYGFWTSAIDGIRYINLPDLWYETGTLNRNYKVLRFEIKENSISYDLDNVF